MDVDRVIYLHVVGLGEVHEEVVYFNLNAYLKLTDLTFQLCSSSKVLLNSIALV